MSFAFRAPRGRVPRGGPLWEESARRGTEQSLHENKARPQSGYGERAKEEDPLSPQRRPRNEGGEAVNRGGPFFPGTTNKNGLPSGDGQQGGEGENENAFLLDVFLPTSQVAKEGNLRSPGGCLQKPRTKKSTARLARRASLEFPPTSPQKCPA